MEESDTNAETMRSDPGRNQKVVVVMIIFMIVVLVTFRLYQG